MQSVELSSVTEVKLKVADESFFFFFCSEMSNFRNESESEDSCRPFYRLLKGEG